LAQALIKGVGAVMAKRLIESSVLETLDIIEQQPQRLREVRALEKKRSE